MIRALLALLLLAALSTVRAEERILDYDIGVDIRADGSLDVTERITVNAEGNQIRRGIYRDFPTRYTDRYGNRVSVDLEVLGVERDGRPEPWFTERRNNGIRINTGNDDYLPVPAEHTFTLRYRTTRQLGFFADHDELYWNAIGTGWIFPIERASVEARLPVKVPTAQMSSEGYTGPQGAKGTQYETHLPADGVARWQLTAPLASYEGFTIVLTFPKGVIPEPTRAQRFIWLLKDNRGVLVALAGLILLLVFCVYEWRRVGRDPHKGIIIARYEPPTGQTPASLRYLRRMGYDTRCFSSAVLALAVSGRLRIVREKRLLKDEWQLLPNPSSPAPADASQSALVERLFKGRAEPLILKNSNAATVSAAMSGHSRMLDKTMQPRYFKRNGWSLAKAVAIAVAAIALALLMARGTGLVAIIAVGALAVATLFGFGALVRAPTPEGRKLLDEIEGLKLYLSVAERDELARVSGPEGPPQLDARRYEELLPYAVALEVEDAWTEKFTLAVGAAAAAVVANDMSWYDGGKVSDLGSLSRAIGSSLSSQIASSSRPPGSSSGSGGGGSSGGGGGGGGGGGR
ncbi:MAG TPA: DUF2207 domain-containing protein [Povalibacter sp.]|nr:DUF2207 domain-containing protein [Povalibacter sp.]